MTITINGKTAAIKEGTAFDINIENPAFGESKSASLEIEFPLKEQNFEIFGPIHIKPFDKNRVFDCTIELPGQTLTGYLQVTEVNEATLKAQFIEGEQTTDNPLESIYIDEIAYGYSDGVVRPWQRLTGGKIYQENWVTYDDDDNPVEPETVSRMPYLVNILTAAIRAAGYTPTGINLGGYANLIICNAVPYDWDKHDYKYALPHWTVQQFLTEVGNLVGGTFTVNHSTRTVTFAFAGFATDTTTRIDDRLVDDYTVQVDNDATLKYIGNNTLKYADNEIDEYQELHNCQWLIEQMIKEGKVYHYTDYGHAQSGWDKYVADCLWGIRHGSSPVEPYIRPVAEGRAIATIEGVDGYFFCGYKAQGANIYQPIVQRTGQYDEHNNPVYIGLLKAARELDINYINNQGASVLQDNAEEVELNIIPVGYRRGTRKSRITPLIATSTALFDESGVTQTIPIEPEEEPEDKVLEQAGLYTDAEQYIPNRVTIGEGSTDKKAFFDKIYVGYADTHDPHFIYTTNSGQGSSALRLRGKQWANGNTVPHIDPTCKYSYSLISDTVPDINSIFIIYGQRYICKTLTLTITTNGRSQLIKGEFYKIIEN